MINIPPTDLERRREDYSLITGRASYVDDIRLAEGRPEVLHMAVVRSPYAHAEIRGIAYAEARKLPGVVAVLGGPELEEQVSPFVNMPLPLRDFKKPERRPLAVGRARYVGDPVAVVLAESCAIAEDARDLVDVDYEPLASVTDPEAALEADAPLLYPEFGTNMAYDEPLAIGNSEQIFARAEHVVRLRLINQRLAPSSIEPRACLFDYDADTGQLAAWLSSQAVYQARDLLASMLGLDRERIKVYNAEVGGAFGAKTRFVGEELVAAALAIQYARPVKWIEGRSENLQAQTHGRGQINYVEAAFQSDGLLLALKVRIVADLGAFLNGVSAMVPSRTPRMLSGPYRLQALDSRVRGVFTNKVPTSPYRGAGRPEATYILERTMERIARELALDPVEVRRRNFIAADAFPHHTITGSQYDSGNYQAALNRVLELAGYERWREQQRQRREQGSERLLGIGLATFTEVSGDEMSPPNRPREAATVRIRRDGSILVQSGVSHNGQGHFTVFAQIAAATFHLPGSQIEVRMNDSAIPGFSIGTFGSRITQVGGSAVLLAAEAAHAKALQIASQELEVATEDLLLEDGRVQVRGTPTRSIALGELARLVEEQPDRIEHEAPNPVNGTPIEGLAAWRDFAPTGAGYASGAHIAVVEVDSATGIVSILAYVAVDDCGRVLNHALTEAQVHGSLAQGIGQALYEEIQYDRDEGQLLTGTLMDYALPIAEQIPAFTTAFVETPSPTNPLGTKGIGESGTIGAPPTIVNAVLDALAPLGITTIDMPLTSEKVWRLVQAARAGTLSQPEPALPW